MTSTATPTLCGHKLLSASTDTSPAVLECRYCGHTWGIFGEAPRRKKCPKCSRCGDPRHASRPKLSPRFERRFEGDPGEFQDEPDTNAGRAAVERMREGLHPHEAARVVGITGQYAVKLFYRYVLPARLRAEIDRLTAELRQRAG